MHENKAHIRKNDTVMVIAGKEKGKSGRVLRVLPEKQRVVIERVNFVKRHARPSRQFRQGGIIEKEASIHISNVMIMCPKCNKPVRVGTKRLEDGKKARICRKCEEVLEAK
jgi:large subunit ribosomal protein L24